MKLGHGIYVVRETMNVPIELVAAKTGMNPEYLKMLELDKLMPSKDELEKIATAIHPYIKPSMFGIFGTEYSDMKEHIRDVAIENILPLLKSMMLSVLREVRDGKDVDEKITDKAFNQQKDELKAILERMLNNNLRPSSELN